MGTVLRGQTWEVRNIYHHHPESKNQKSSEANSGSLHPYGRYGNAVKPRKTISTITILWPIKAIFEKRAATVEVDTLISLADRSKNADLCRKPEMDVRTNLAGNLKGR